MDFLANHKIQKDREFWFKIVRLDDRVDDETVVAGTVRKNIRVHFGGNSWGCLTFAIPKDYLEFVKALSDAKPGWYDPKKGSFHDSGSFGMIQYFGKIVIPHSGSVARD